LSWKIAAAPNRHPTPVSVSSTRTVRTEPYSFWLVGVIALVFFAGVLVYILVRRNRRAAGTLDGLANPA